LTIGNESTCVGSSKGRMALVQGLKKKNNPKVKKKDKWETHK